VVLPQNLQYQRRATRVLAVGYFLQILLYGLEHRRQTQHCLEVQAASRNLNHGWHGWHGGLDRTAEVMWKMDLVARSSPGLGANTDLAARSSWSESNFRRVLPKRECIA